MTRIELRRHRNCGGSTLRSPDSPALRAGAGFRAEPSGVCPRIRRRPSCVQGLIDASPAAYRALDDDESMANT